MPGGGKNPSSLKCIQCPTYLQLWCVANGGMRDMKWWLCCWYAVSYRMWSSCTSRPKLFATCNKWYPKMVPQKGFTTIQFELRYLGHVSTAIYTVFGWLRQALVSPKTMDVLFFSRPVCFWEKLALWQTRHGSTMQVVFPTPHYAEVHWMPLL